MTDIDTAEGREEWRPVSGYEGFYEVSDQGRVRSVDRIVPHRSGMTAIKGCILSPSRSTKRGYLTVRLTRDGKSASKQVHRLLAEAFIYGMEVAALTWDHIRGLKHDIGMWGGE